MSLFLPIRLVAAIGAACACLPAAAHLSAGAPPHWHAADAWGALAVIALTGVAAWVDRRGR